METELLRIFDDHHRPIGTATRKEVHRKGYWHETFHCWVLEGDMIYFQIRSEDKKDYPGLLDITAAGHLSANERVEDGVREISEEIGLELTFSELIPLGVIKNEIKLDTITDLEFSHVFVYQGQNVSGSCSLKPDEVSGLVKATFESFYELVHEGVDVIHVEGTVTDHLGVERFIQQQIGLQDLVPHDSNYLLEVTEHINEILRII
ncbi:NUDIX domain-containing protein [Chungangia koreensis]|uniref:NUDIX domain-containing protein n=1 Tax=Chungangia koreensis TaxID=752657 RepID=A0ABV8X1R5_9LACT